MRGERTDYPPVEAFVLSRLCSCSVDDVVAAAATLRLPRFSERWCSRLVHLRRTAWHLGVVLEAEPHRAGRRPWKVGHRGLVKVNFKEPTGEKTADFFLVETQDSEVPAAAPDQAVRWAGEWLAGYDGEPRPVDLWEARWARDQLAFRYATFLRHVGPVHS